MVARVLIIGTGDMGDRFAAGLAASGRVREMWLTDVSPELGVKAATMASSFDCIVRSESLDACRQRDVDRDGRLPAMADQLKSLSGVR